MATVSRDDMKPKIYVETTIVSYLVARPSRDVVVAAHQQITDEWWETRRQSFDLFASQVVLREAGAGDKEMARRRIELLEHAGLLEVTDEALELAERLLASGALPTKAAEDALHIAVAVVNGMDYLITWNCKHIANAAIRSKIEQLCRANGYTPSVICTPEELLEE